jgi:hypothetical protein
MTELLVNDQLSMDRVNPYTASQTFGVPYNGGDYLYPDMKWAAPDDGPASWNMPPEHPEYNDHLAPMARDRSGAMYLKTGGVDPATSFMFPARKIQYDDGTTSWSRETVWRNGENYTNEPLFGHKESLFPIWFMLILLLVIFVVAKVLKV